MDATSVVHLRRANDSRTRALELSAQLRTAVAQGDDAAIAPLLGELLRFKGTGRGQTISLQLRALQSLVALLRSAAMNDEVTGLHNSRGFLQCATRLLDVAVRERCPHRLVYIHLSMYADTSTDIPMIVLRQMGNTLRDLFPNYGVYEALGRLGAAEFAALTPGVEVLTRDSIVRHIAATPLGQGPARTRLTVGIARFDPLRPVGIDELLASARRSLFAREPLGRTASSVLGPPTRNGASLTVSERRQYAPCQE